MKYWLFLTNEENWEIIKDKNIYGFTEIRKKEIKKLSLGDRVLVYIKGNQIGGLFRICDLDYKTNIKFPYGDYIHKIKLEKIKVPRYTRKIYKDTINKITMFKRKDRWGVYLMGKGVIELNKEDHDTFAKLLN